MIIQFLLEQHKDLLALADKISKDIRMNCPHGIEGVRSGVCELSGKFQVFFTMAEHELSNDNFKDDESPKQLDIARMKKEMTKFAEQFSAYNERWGALSDVYAEEQRFLNDTVILFENLTLRLKSQEEDLYPLLKKA